MSEPLQIITAVIAGISLIANIILAFRQNTINNNFEKYKNELEKKTYISKARFDTEFLIYRDLSLLIINLTYTTADCACIFEDGNFTLKDYEERYNKASNSCLKAFTALRQNAPFMPENIYLLFSNLIEQCKAHLNNFFIYCIKPHDQNTDYENLEEIKEAILNYKKIQNLLDNTMTELRKYLNTLNTVN